MMKDPNRRRSEEITNSYFVFIEKHVGEVVSGVAPKFMKLDQIARALFVSHKHLTNTVQKETGNHPCHFYDLKIIELAKKKLAGTDLSIAEIARIFTYDPSNFSKFFKKLVGQTPQQWRLGNPDK
ncbi:MAG: helix-turn-helix transcriptional regulator [Chitinophagaceae bacterium]|nr:helix-turn-helix transcriptional regulator [Chitinophagaceae bacterium]